MSVVDFYKTQIRILWEWRGGPTALLKRLVITLLVSTFALYLTAAILPGIRIGRLVDAAVAVILMALFNALIRPVILAFASSRSLVLTGIMVIVLQVVTFLLIAPLAHGVFVDGLISALIGSFIYAAIDTALTSILGVDSGGSYFGLLVSSLLAKQTKEKSDAPGLVVIQIDGLPTVRVKVDYLPPPDFEATTFADFMVLGMIMTAMPAINAIPLVVDAPPGIKTYVDLPLPLPRGWVPR
jgi:uncharacterized membrane protein YvlD (DUF360 family)